MDKKKWMAGMSACTGGVPQRVLKVEEGMFLEMGDCIDLLVCAPEEGAEAYWVNAVYVTLDSDDPITRSLLAWQTHSSRLSSFSSSTSSSPSSSTFSGGVDVQAARERVASSMSGHPTEACWRVYTHAERDILDLCDEVERLRERLRG